MPNQNDSKPVDPKVVVADRDKILKEMSEQANDLQEDFESKIAALIKDNQVLADNSAKKIAELEKKLKAAGGSNRSGDFVKFQGQVYDIIGDYRADNTFVEVKKGHCPEGVTLIAIKKPH